MSWSILILAFVTAQRLGELILARRNTKALLAQGAYELEEGALDHERQVLAEFGNMSAPTALFVLERVLADDPAERLLVTALGPGFTASALSLVRQ